MHILAALSDLAPAPVVLMHAQCIPFAASWSIRRRIPSRLFNAGLVCEKKSILLVTAYVSV